MMDTQHHGALIDCSSLSLAAYDQFLQAKTQPRYAAGKRDHDYQLERAQVRVERLERALRARGRAP